MARPIPLELPARDPRAEIQARLQAAPAAHAEALLAAYEVLQGLNDRGVFELLRGALGSSDKLVEIAVDAAKSPDSIRGIRNLLLLINMLGEIDPEKLKIFTQAIPPAVEAAGRQPQRVGLGKLIAGFWNKDSRRGLAAINTALEMLGKRLSSEPGK